MPPAASGRILIEHGDGEAARAGRRVAPRQLRRAIAAFAVVLIENLRVIHAAARMETGAGQRERAFCKCARTMRCE
jgi:hypothetical protein